MVRDDDREGTGRGVQVDPHEAMTPDYLAKPLTPYPLPTKDGAILRTIGDVSTLHAGHKSFHAR
jgi:hypothetical protein